MSSDNHANYARIGFAVVIGVIAIVATLVYIGGLGAKDDCVFVETYCDKPISGLSVGSAVNLRGVKVGEVNQIDFVGNRYDVPDDLDHLIYIRMAINGRHLRTYESDGISMHNAIQHMVDKGLRASVTASGVTGLSRIECDFFPSEQASLQAKWRPKHPYVPSRRSLLHNFSDAATKVMNQINTMDISTVWSNINATVEHLAQASDGAKSMIEGQRDDYEQILSNVKEISATVRDLSAELRANPSLLLRERIAEPLPETTR